MEPVSITASLVTLLGLAGAASEFVYNFILDIRDVPLETRSQADKLKCLHKTIITLVALYRPEPPTPQLALDTNLEGHLRKFLREIQALEFRLRESSAKINKSRKQHLWERMAWLSTDRRLNKFYVSLDDWMRIFSVAVDTTQLSLLVKVLEQTSPTRHLTASPLPAQQEQSAIQLDAHQQIGWQNDATYPDMKAVLPLDQKAIFPPVLRAFLKQRCDVVGFISQSSYTYTTKKVSAKIQAGLAIVRSWSNNGTAIRSTVPWKQGACLLLIIQMRWLISRRISITIGYVVEKPRISATWNLSTSGILHESHPALVACENGDWLKLRRLLKDKQASIFDKTGRYGYTLLHVAAQKGHYDIVNGLLQQGAHVDAEDDWGQSPLYKTILFNCGYIIASCLLAYGADLSHQDMSGRTVLHNRLSETGKAVLNFHKEYIDNEIHDGFGKSISYYVGWRESSLPVELFRCYSYATSLERTDPGGRNALHFACRVGNVKTIETLLRYKKAALSHPDWNGETLMHYAAWDRTAQTIDALIRNGFDIHAIDKDGRTALHHAALAGNVSTAAKFLDLGAEPDLHVDDKDGRTPYQLALWRENKRMVDYLRLRYPDLPVLECSHTDTSNNTQDQAIPAQPGFSSVKNAQTVPKQRYSLSEILYIFLETLGIYMLLWLTARLGSVFRDTT